MITKLKKGKWNTYYCGCYTYNVGGDLRSAGGCHFHEIRKTAKGWQKRIRQSNGRFTTYGNPEFISDEDGEEAFEKAQKY